MGGGEDGDRVRIPQSPPHPRLPLPLTARQPDGLQMDSEPI